MDGNPNEKIKKTVMTHNGQKNRKMSMSGETQGVVGVGAGAPVLILVRGGSCDAAYRYLRCSCTLLVIKPPELAVTPTLDRYSLMTWMK